MAREGFAAGASTRDGWPRFVRRWLLALVLAVVAGGCAHDYLWIQDGEPPSERCTWEVVGTNELYSICRISRAAEPRLVACAIQVRQTGTCCIYSVLTEEQAKRTIDGDGLSVWTHEMRHCEGKRHVPGHVPRTN